MATVTDSGARQKASEMIAALREHIAAAMPNMAEVIQKIVVERSPTIDEEYAALMVGDGNPSNVALVPRGPGGSADSDLPRRRLIKDESTYLQMINASPANKMTDAENLRFGVGFLPMLLENTRYKYINVQAGAPVEKNGPGPYFGAFEFGTLNVDAIAARGSVNPNVGPRAVSRKGKVYPLLPSDVKDERGHYVDAKSSMNKPITPRYMYLRTVLDPEVKSLMEACLKAFGDGHFL